MKRERLEVCDTTTTDTPSPRPYKRPKESERRSFKTEQLEEVNNSPQTHQRWRHNTGKRRALDRDFATKLASITLISGDLAKLDTIYGGAYDDAQLEQFSRAVSGCLCRLGRHAVGQKSEVIAFIDAVVGPVDLHQMAFSQRRIFVFQLGYFEFDQIADQKPDLVDYGPWMADMDIQSLPLPSDEFISEKAQMLQSLLAFDTSGQQIERDHFTKSERPEEPCRGIDQQDAADDDDDDDVQILDLETASSTVKTEASDARDIGDDMEEGELLEDDADEVEEEMDDEPPLDKLVHSIESLRRVRLMLCKVRPRNEAICECLVGCLVVCHTKNGTAKVIVDEIIQVDGTKIIFKHLSTPYLISELVDHEITDNIFRNWIDNMARWGEQLPLSSLYHARRLRVYEKLKAVKKSLKSAKNQRDKQRKREKREKARQQAENNEHHQQTKSKKDGKEADDIDELNSRNMFRKAFGSVIEKIMVTPKHLVQLLQRGRTEFERVAVGLYVRCTVTMGGKKRQRLWLVEQIKRISWNAKPYAMYGEQLTVLLHFDHHCCTINAVQFRKPEIIKKLVRQQKLAANFISPSGEHILRKSEELQAALRDTVRLTAHPFQKIKTDRK